MKLSMTSGTSMTAGFFSVPNGINTPARWSVQKV